MWAGWKKEGQLGGGHTIPGMRSEEEWSEKIPELQEGQSLHMGNKREERVRSNFHTHRIKP